MPVNNKKAVLQAPKVRTVAVVAGTSPLAAPRSKDKPPPKPPKLLKPRKLPEPLSSLGASPKPRGSVGAPSKPKPPTAQTKTIESAVTPIEPARRRRSNRRSEQTIDNILLVTERIVLESGAHRISILEVCKAAGVSRGTFYRYFASQDELLDAFSRHKRERFHHSLQEATQGHDDPDERFAALVAYLESYLEHGNSRRLLIVAPEYALGFFKRIFNDSVVRFQDVLRPVFDAWDERLGVKLDRELVCEMLIRYVLSEQLAPGDPERKSLTRRVGRMVEALTAGVPSRLRR